LEGVISLVGNKTAPVGAAPITDGTGTKLPVHGFFRAHVWHPLAETVGEAYRKQYYPLGYTPALDGLRGLMTVGIIVAHVQLWLAPGVVVFMDIFFVMSGYFITSLLLRDIQRHGGIRYGEFYRRRFARILPPFLVMVLAYLLYRSIFLPPFRDALVDALIAFTYIENWWKAFDLPGAQFMFHTWSLAIEEQFYLLWPITLALLVRIYGVRWRLVFVIGAIALAVWGWRIWLTTTTDPRFWRLYAGLDTHADALMVGCALGVALKLAPAGAYPKVGRFLPKLAWPFIVGSLATMMFVSWGVNPPSSTEVIAGRTFYFNVGIMVCGALPGAMLITLLLRTSGTVLHRILERPEIVFLGKIFYGMYLWHYPILKMLLIGTPDLVRFFVGFPLTVLLATLSYAYIERHFMRVRSAPAQPVAAGSAYASASS
jgi:peptidoglycan/LPS O-acetylase OafA/YrhL